MAMQSTKMIAVVIISTQNTNNSQLLVGIVTNQSTPRKIYLSVHAEAPI